MDAASVEKKPTHYVATPFNFFVFPDAKSGARLVMCVRVGEVAETGNLFSCCLLTAVYNLPRPAYCTAFVPRTAA